MSLEDRGRSFVRVTDRAGNDFVCPIDALRNPDSLTDDELDNCVDDATVGRYAGDIEIKNS
jgi:hypothetical protein